MARIYYNQESIITAFRTAHGDRYGYHDVFFRTVNDEVVIHCPTHGAFRQIAYEHKSGKGCRQCSQIANAQAARRAHVARFDFKATSDAISKAYGGRITLIESLAEAPSKNLLHRCSCGTEFRASANDTKRGMAACPACSKIRSNAEREIAAIIEKAGFKVITQHRIDGIEFDIFCPEKKLAIEHHGLWWHAEKRNHVEKYIIAKRNGVRLLQVYSDEWLDRRDQVLALIWRSLGVPQPTIYARRCKVEIITHDQAFIFMEKNHIQGMCRPGHSLALTHDGSMVAVMVFTPPYSARGNSAPGQWELARFATSCNVPGAASRLLKAFITTKSPALIKSYADHRLFTGGMYERLGFQSIGTAVDYEYIFKGKRWHKSSFQKSRIAKAFHDVFSAEKTETQMTEELGAKRIWNAGRTTFVMRLSDIAQEALGDNEAPLLPIEAIEETINQARRDTHSLLSKASTRRWSDPEFKAKMKALHQAPENIARIRAQQGAGKERWWVHHKHGERFTWHNDLRLEFGGTHTNWCRAFNEPGRQIKGWRLKGSEPRKAGRPAS